MALQVGELYAKMTLNDAEFKKKLKDAEKQIKDLAKASSAAFAAIAGSMTAAAVAASNYAGEATALAGQTGLATEAVQALGYAARRSDADLGLLGAGMRSLIRRAAEAAQGHQGFLASFEDLGLSAERLTELLRDPEQLLLEVADAIAELPTEAHASAAAMNVMSESGRRLVPFLRQGSNGIRGLTSDAERMGLVMSDTAIQDLYRFGDEMGIIQERVAAVSRVLAVQFLPTIRATLDAIDDAVNRFHAMDENTKGLIGTIGAGTVGAVGAFAAMTTAIWGATRALQALGAVFKLASGPAGWIMLATTSVLSLVAGLEATQRHARAARQAIIDLGDTEEATRELEKVRAEIEAIQKSMSTDLTEPVRGGPQILFVAEGQLEELREQEKALVQRLEDIAEAERERQKALEALGDVTIEIPRTESETFRRWQKDIEAVRREMELFAEELYITTELMDAAVDQAQFRRAVEEETVQLLRRELEIQKAIAEATRSALNTASLLPDEAEELTFQLAMAEASVGRLEKELRQAEETLRLADYSTPFERLNHLASLFRLQLETGVRPADEIMERVNEILNSMDDLNDGTVTYLRTLREWKMLAEQVQNAMPEPLTPVRPGAPVGPTPTITRDQARIEELADAFGRLELRVDASVVPMEDAIAKLHEMRSEIIRMAAASGGLANANEEQLRLYNQLTRSLERWMQSLESLPSRLEEIRAEMDRALGVGMAVEREIARATGVPFDELAYEMEVLRQTLQTMSAETAEITPEMQGLLETLRELGEEHRRRADAERLATAAIQGVTRNLGILGRLLDGSVSFRSGQGLSFDPAQMGANAILMATEALFSAFDGSEKTASMLERAANALERATRGWQEMLSEGQFHELLAADPSDEMAELERNIRAHQRRVDDLEKRWLQVWNAASRGRQIEQLNDQISEMQAALEELEESWERDIERRVTQLLGVGVRDLQSAVSSAFGASTVEDFTDQMERSLTGKVRNAFVTAAIEDVIMGPLFERLGSEIRETLAGVDSILDLDESALDSIRDLSDEITREATLRYEVIDSLGLLADVTERVNNEFARLVNVPMGMRALQTLRFQSATPQVVPALAGAGGGGGEGNVYIEHISLPNVSNAQEFERDMRRLQRRDGLRRAGNPTAMRRLR